MKKVKTAVIGLGIRGRTLLGAALACEEAEIVAVCDKYDDRMQLALLMIAMRGRNIRWQLRGGRLFMRIIFKKIGLR